MKNPSWFVFGVIHLLCACTATGEAKKRRPQEVHVQPNGPQMGQAGYLTCPVFGDNGCRIICEIFCDFYNCQSQGQCSNDTICNCYEKYNIFSQQLTPHQYQTLPTSTIWRYKFGFSPNATSLYYILQKSGDLWENFEPVLRNPAQTAISIKSHLLYLHPDWSFIRNLIPKRQGYVDDFISHHASKYDDEHIEFYNDMVMDYIADKYYYSLKGLRNKPHQTMGNPKSRQQTKYFYKLVNLCQNAWLMDYVKDFVQRKGYDDSYLMELLDPKGRKQIARSGLLSLLIISTIDFLMNYEKYYNKSTIYGSQKHTVYYLLSKRQIDELNDLDFDDFEEEMAKAMGQQPWT
ncbi:uncharacterized protein LOC135834854 [Planococcus citri]|uniref:uncharacterized protein LOC135834854 n=1 Tax=Planococcus citri TaxID=170843 RepID=UPI0031F8FA0C